MLDRSLTLSPNVRISALSIPCQCSLVKNVIETFCDKHGVNPSSVVNGFRGSRAEQNARAVIIFVLTELGMERNQLARILDKDYVTMGTSLHRTHTKVQSSPQYAQTIMTSMALFAEVTLEMLWG